MMDSKKERGSYQRRQSNERSIKQTCSRQKPSTQVEEHDETGYGQGFEGPFLPNSPPAHPFRAFHRVKRLVCDEPIESHSTAIPATCRQFVRHLSASTEIPMGSIRSHARRIGDHLMFHSVVAKGGNYFPTYIYSLHSSF